jgi:hypothetical protein
VVAALCEPPRHVLDSIIGRRADTLRKRGHDKIDPETNVISERVSRSIPAMIESISAITLATHNMSRAVRFLSHAGI